MLRIVPRLDWRGVWVYDVYLANTLIDEGFYEAGARRRVQRCLAWCYA